MCLILFAYRYTPDTPLILAANRDEFYRRPTRSMRFWPENPQLLAGKDQQQGGTWLGITRHGRFAAITNYRERPDLTADRPSRGELALDFLRSEQAPCKWLEAIADRIDAYNGFNLLVGDPGGLWYLGNRGEDRRARALTPGLYGLSNEVLDSPWFKVTEGKIELADACGRGAPHQELLDLLRNRQRAPDHRLPNTGIGTKLERMLSPRFIRSAWYGTRASTALTIHGNGEVSVSEQNYLNFGIKRQLRTFQFALTAAQRWTAPDIS